MDLIRIHVEDVLATRQSQLPAKPSQMVCTRAICIYIGSTSGPTEFIE